MTEEERRLRHLKAQIDYTANEIKYLVDSLQRLIVQFYQMNENGERK